MKKTPSRCVYCHQTPPKEMMTRDHRVPRVRAKGKAWEGNIVPACKPCNQAKGDMSEWTFREWLETDGGKKWRFLPFAERMKHTGVAIRWAAARDKV